MYEYQIGGDEAWSEIATFTTVSVEKNETNFFVLGDIQAEDTRLHSRKPFYRGMHLHEWKYIRQLHFP